MSTPIFRKEYHRQWYLANRKKKLRQNKNWRLRNPGRMRKLVNAWYQKNSTKHKIKTQLARKLRFEANPKIKALYALKRARWYRKNRAIFAQKQRERRRTDLNFRLACVLRSRVASALNGRSKAARTLKLLGCSVPRLQLHLSSLFKSGMTWENYGRKGWHIDHIRPVSTFDLSNFAQQRRCFHYTNLQPLWAKENQQKKNRWP